MVKNAPANAADAEDAALIPGLERPPWRRKLQPTPVSRTGKSQEQRSLAGWSPRGRKESDTTERLSTWTGWNITNYISYYLCCICPLIHQWTLRLFPYLGCCEYFSSVTQSCPTLCDPRDCSMPGLPVHH